MFIDDPDLLPDIEAEITFLSTDEGGRQMPVFSGYRPQFYYAGEDHCATHWYPDVESVAPGETARTLLRFLMPEVHVERVQTGIRFQIREGSRVVANGRVTKVLNLAESARIAQGE